jgi:hypothetical protein
LRQEAWRQGPATAISSSLSRSISFDERFCAFLLSTKRTGAGYGSREMPLDGRMFVQLAQAAEKLALLDTQSLCFVSDDQKSPYES